MEQTHLTQLVADRRAARESAARDHRLTKDVEPHAARGPRFPHERRRRPATRHESLVGG